MDQVQEVKQKTDIVQLVSEYVELKRAGRNYKGSCPFHGEKTPSFMVNPELQIYKCFGCGEGGDCFAFLQRTEGMDFSESLKKLAERAGVKLTSYRPSKQEEERERLIKMNQVAAEAYHFLLNKHKSGEAARKYVGSRGITEEMVQLFRLGFAPDDWNFLEAFLVRKKGYNPFDLEKAGLVVPGRRYDRFRNRLMFPLSNNRGQVVGFAGRVLPGADEKAGGKYVNTPETEIYHKSELLYGYDLTRADIKKAGWAVVVEGELDAIASYQAGVKNVVAIKGSALTERQVELLARVCETVVLALDADMAGDAAARRGIEIAERKNLMVKMVQKLKNSKTQELKKDPGELAIEDPEGWKMAVETAIPIYDFYLESAVERYGLEIGGKKKIGQELLPIWATIGDEIVKSHYVQKLAEVLGVGDEDIRKQMEKNQKSDNQKPQNPVKNSVPSKKTKREVREERVVQAGIMGEKLEELTSEPVKEMIKSEFWKKVVEQLGASLQKNGGAGAVTGLPAELKERVGNLLLTEEQFEDKAWNEAVRLLETLEIEETLETERDPEKVRKLAERKSRLTRDV